MITISCIVEGDGEVAALPVLLRRILAWQLPEMAVDITAPIRVAKDRFINREDEFRRHVELASRKTGETGVVLVLLDADDDCPVELARSVVQRAGGVAPHSRISVVVATREYEAWLIAGYSGFEGRRGFHSLAGDELSEAEHPRDAKGWLRHRMQPGTYRETTDQPAFSARVDLDQAFARSRSFRKLCSDLNRFLIP